jgi:hypothetical protein
LVEIGVAKEGCFERKRLSCMADIEQIVRSKDVSSQVGKKYNVRKQF